MSGNHNSHKSNKLRVAFIFPPPWGKDYPSYAMALFKASTKKHGEEFWGFDLNVDMHNAVNEEDKHLWEQAYANRWVAEHQDIILKYSEFIDAYVDNMIAQKIDLYAISINGYSKYIADYIAKLIKEKNPQAGVFFGGPSCFPAYTGLSVLDNKYVDAICTGEGDILWPKILEHYKKNKNMRIDMPGIAYKNEDGSIVDHGSPELITDLDSIPFADYSDIDFNKYGNKYRFSIMTSRGCINTCAFCSEKPNFFKYRFRRAENVFSEISKHLSDLQKNPTFPSDGTAVPFINFNDSLINGSIKELDKFCDMVIESGLNFRWAGMALMRKEMTLELLLKMHKAGCRNLAWGMESGCQEVLDLMHKRFFTLDLAKEIIKSAHQAKLGQSISLIAGFPGETEEMFNKTKEFVAEYKKYLAIGIQPMMIAKNSLVADKPEEFGLSKESNWLKWESADGQNTYDVRLRRIEEIKAIMNGNVLTIDK